MKKRMWQALTVVTVVMTLILVGLGVDMSAYAAGIQVTIGNEEGTGVLLSADTPYYDVASQTAVADEPSGGYAYLNVNANPITLTLHDFSLDGGYYARTSDHAMGIYVTDSDNLKLILEGNNTLNVGKTPSGHSSYAVYIEDGNIQVEGNGTFTITAPDTNANVGTFLVMAGSLTVNDGEIEATCVSAPAMSVAIKVNQNIVVNGGSLTGIANDNTGYPSGIATSNGDITINAGSITAYAAGGRGIGLQLGLASANDKDRSNRFLYINGGTVTTTAPRGIGTIQTTNISGGLLKITETITTDMERFSCDKCVLIINGKGMVYGDYTLEEDLVIGSGENLVIPEGSTLIVPAGKTLTNNGTIEGTGTIMNNGTVICNSHHIYGTCIPNGDDTHTRTCCCGATLDGDCVYADATCIAPPTCTDCSGTNGEMNPNKHDGGTQIRDAFPATSTTDGYTGDTYCLGCGEKIGSGSVISSSAKAARAFTEELLKRAAAAKPGDTLKIDATVWHSFSANVLKELFSKEGVNYTFYYNYGGECFYVDVPQGAEPEEGIEWYGPLKLNAMFGRTMIQKSEFDATLFK